MAEKELWRTWDHSEQEQLRQDVAVNQPIAVQLPSYKAEYARGRVTAVSKTQFTVEYEHQGHKTTIRVMKKRGNVVGEADMWHTSLVYILTPDGEEYLAQVLARQQEKVKHEKLIYRLHNANYDRYANEQLGRLAALLDLFDKEGKE